MRRTYVVLAGLLALAGLTVTIVASAQGRTTLVARMNGDKEVSSEGEKGVGDEDGFGGARINLRPADGQVCFRLSWNNISAPTMAHIHEGGPNEAGPAIVTLFQSEDPLPSTIATVKGCVDDVAQDVINAIKNDPKGHYVNVHNTDFPGGAIRGQLRKG